MHCIITFKTSYIGDNNIVTLIHSLMINADKSGKESQLLARILSALGLQDTASGKHKFVKNNIIILMYCAISSYIAQSCNFNGQRLCLYIRAGGQTQWYCSDQCELNKIWQDAIN